MQKQFTEDWFYTIFSQQDTYIDFSEREIEVSATCESTPELRQLLKTNEDTLEVSLCIDTPSFSPCVIFMNIPDENEVFDDTDSYTAMAALKRLIMDRYHMGLISYWQQEVDKDRPTYRQLTEGEKERIEQYIGLKHRNTPICRDCQTAVDTIDSMIRELTSTLDAQEVFDPSLCDFLSCLSKLKCEILEKGLPTIVDADMYYEIVINRKELAIKLCHVRILYELDRLLGLFDKGQKDTKPSLGTYRSTLYSSAFPLLSCPEFAKRCGVEQVTVRQWIRRGKLRSAIRFGRDWKIPSTTKRPTEGFTPAFYHIISHIPEEAELKYPFLGGIHSPSSFYIEEAGAGSYLVTDKTYTQTRLLAKMTRSEREEFERYLLDADWVQYDLQERILKISG